MNSNDITRLIISVILIGGLMSIIVVSIFKNNFEFPIKITEVFSGWIVAIMLFFFQQKEIEEKSEQVEEKTSKARQIADVVSDLSKGNEKVEKLLEYLSDNHPKIIEEITERNII